MAMQHLNPEGMLESPAFSQGILAPAGARTLYLGGRPNPPTIVVLRVAGLGMSPEVLVEIEATAVLGHGSGVADGDARAAKHRAILVRHPFEDPGRGADPSTCPPEPRGTKR